MQDPREVPFNLLKVIRDPEFKDCEVRMVVKAPDGIFIDPKVLKAFGAQKERDIVGMSVCVERDEDPGLLVSLHTIHKGINVPKIWKKVSLPESQNDIIKSINDTRYSIDVNNPITPMEAVMRCMKALAATKLPVYLYGYGGSNVEHAWVNVLNDVFRTALQWSGVSEIHNTTTRHRAYIPKDIPDDAVIKITIHSVSAQQLANLVRARDFALNIEGLDLTNCQFIYELYNNTQQLSVKDKAQTPKVVWSVSNNPDYAISMFGWIRSIADKTTTDCILSIQSNQDFGLRVFNYINYTHKLADREILPETYMPLQQGGRMRHSARAVARAPHRGR